MTNVSYLNEVKSTSLSTDFHLQDIKFNISDIKKSDFKFILYSQQLLNSYIDTVNATLKLIKNNKNPKFKNKASDTLSLLNFKKYLSIENN